MIDICDDQIVHERRTSGGRFVLFCSTDLPRGCQLPWWSAMLDTNGDAFAILVRLDEASGEQGWTLYSLLSLTAARTEIEATVKRSTLTRDAARHIGMAVKLELDRRGGLHDAGEMVLDTLDPDSPWPWLEAESGDEGTVGFCPSLTGDDDEGVNLELLLTVVDQLVTDAGKAFPDQGQLGGIAIHVGKALDAIARRDCHLRSRALSGADPRRPS